MGGQEGTKGVEGATKLSFLSPCTHKRSILPIFSLQPSLCCVSGIEEPQLCNNVHVSSGEGGATRTKQEIDIGWCATLHGPQSWVSKMHLLSTHVQTEHPH